MPRNGKKRPRSASGVARREEERIASGWKKVEVGLEKDDIVSGGKTIDRNHYDDKTLSARASHDLEADPTEHPGVFLGLEVLDGSQYKIITDEKTGTKQFFVLGAGNLGTSSEDRVVKDVELGPKKKKKKKKKRSESKDNTSNADDVIPKQQSGSSTAHSVQEQNDEAKDPQHEEQLVLIQSQWMPATGGATFHPRLYDALLQNKWFSPTPIQAAVLPAAILGRRNIVGAAPTGSGKTLAFLLPIYQYLFDQKDLQHEDLEKTSRKPLQALILTPTRELALQIHTEAEKLWKGQIGTLVGGLAVAKQQRVLDKNRPSVITATPGRLWELISSRDHEHLNDLSQIRFLVIDEADRMIQQGSFRQLAQILDAVQRANPLHDGNSDDENDSDDDDEENDIDDRMHSLPGIRGEAKVTMLNDDILKQIEDARRKSDNGEESEATNSVGPPDDVVNVDSTEGETASHEGDDDDDTEVVSLPTLPPVNRQTFVYSATLTLPASSSYRPSKSKNKKKVLRGADGAIAEILEKAHASGLTKVVDLTNAAMSKREATNSTVNPTEKGVSLNDTVVDGRTKKAASSIQHQVRLPEGLAFQEIKCTQRHKDSYLYAYLMTTAAGSAGPALIFCNSIAAVRRVGATLQALGLPVRILHAQMQQRARFKAVESLNSSNGSRTVVVATDVAARGLDVPSISTIVHYDAARTMDTFIHRSGRTARGIGEGAVGSSLSLVSPEEDKFHTMIVHSLQVRFEPVNMDGRLLNSSQERVNLASKVVIAEEKQSKTQRRNQWFRETAEEAGIEVDDICFEDGLEDGDNRNVCELRNSQTAKVRLQALLSQPMQTQKFGKFLSTNSALSHDIPNQFLVAPIAKGKNRHRRQNQASTSRS